MSATLPFWQKKKPADPYKGVGRSCPGLENLKNLSLNLEPTNPFNRDMPELRGKVATAHKLTPIIPDSIRSGHEFVNHEEVHVTRVEFLSFPSDPFPDPGTGHHPTTGLVGPLDKLDGKQFPVTLADHVRSLILRDDIHFDVVFLGALGPPNYSLI